MEYKDKKYILKKLMQDALTEEERIALQSSRRVTKEMERQWNNAPDAVESDRPDEPSIWRNICKEVWQHDEGRNVVFYKIYSMVASILLVLGVAGTVYFALQDKANVPMYVVSSGIQNMESVSLPDGTKVQMGPGSRLTYPASFSGKTREIRLDGQAFFDVAKNREKPFIVHTEDMSVEALGTAFELFSYNMENKMEAILLNGKIKVSVENKETNQMKEYFVSPDEKILVDRQTGKIRADLICLVEEEFDPEQDMIIFDQLETWKKTKIKGGTYTLREMLVPVFLKGECVYTSPSVMEIRDICMKEKDTLWDETKRLANPHTVYVDLSDRLYQIKSELLEQMGREALSL